MNRKALNAVFPELQNYLEGRRIGSIFSIAQNQFLFDLSIPGDIWLLISVDPRSPRTHLIKRRFRDLKKHISEPTPFTAALTRSLNSAEISRISVLPDDRILTFEVQKSSGDALGTASRIIIQLTGSSSNLFVVDSEDRILTSARPVMISGQAIGEVYSPPKRIKGEDRKSHGLASGLNIIDAPEGGSVAMTVSEKLDSFYEQLAAKRKFQEQANRIRTALRAKIKQKQRLLKNLNADLEEHGDPKQWKRYGDLLLANISTAIKGDGHFLVTDHFSEDLPTLAVAFENDDPLTKTAEKYFKRYARARNASVKIIEKITETENQLCELGSELAEIERIIEEGDENAIREYGSETTAIIPHKKKIGSAGKRKSGRFENAYRTFISSDGFEIIVGKKARDNDVLTFRVARSLDIWMHAADYPGSHVVIRDSGKKTVSDRTLIEAAELAAFYSQGRKQVKAAVNYTQRKFVNKPKGAAPGLVSLAKFKTILVEPKVPASVQRVDRFE
ncbi:NFACT RNA binding domain-containing protein [Leptolyngbya sp. 7M]|uniref:NFACT RNA binding domain-containing protein n=1 Tax=Leptolyngbya sp. 7M TaxID=2812896 RepID=UPI001B8CB364|nr:NFACT family protein [Leptolyngbya sp. 7M]QYO66991.1 NFACT family protein [Leptolyngbya sp. 7M]